MATEPELTRDQWQIVLEVLQHERKELSSEIYHSDTAGARRELKAREEEVDGLIARLREYLGATAPAVV